MNSLWDELKKLVWEARSAVALSALCKCELKLHELDDDNRNARDVRLLALRALSEQQSKLARLDIERLKGRNSREKFMVGGKIHELIECDGKVWVNVVDAPHGTREYCAIYVQNSDNARRLAVGDSLWWQGNFAMWTPAQNIEDDGAVRDGVDYDIQLARVGYSGVARPELYTRVVTQPGQSLAHMTTDN